MPSLKIVFVFRWGWCTDYWWFGRPTGVFRKNEGQGRYCEIQVHDMDCH